MKNVSQMEKKADHVIKKNQIKWNNSYSMGIKIIDDQHRKVLDVANDLLKYVPKDEKSEREFFKEMVGQVVDYIKVHFATEEGIMLAIKYPGYEEHKKNHEIFIQKVVKNIKDYDAGNRAAIRNFSNFTRKWVLTHITLMDAKYIEFFRKMNINKPDGKQFMQGYNIVATAPGVIPFI
ncbi:MAG: bacteriohemerythrin [Treponema sp.]|nr:bacteriohemerythrin [Treponema sp.]